MEYDDHLKRLIFENLSDKIIKIINESDLNGPEVAALLGAVVAQVLLKDDLHGKTWTSFMCSLGQTITVNYDHIDLGESHE
jgi:hypothetical protein